MPERSHVANRCRRFLVAFLCLLGVGLGGCATTTGLQFARPDRNAPIKILVVQIPIKIDSARLRTVLAPAANPKLPATDASIAQGVRHAQEYALAAMKSALRVRRGLIVAAAPPTGEKPLIDEVQGERFDAGLSQPEADRIKTATGADALLRFRITDYGLTPRSWRNGYIAFEVSSTLALTAAIAYAGSNAAKAAAGAYLAQETVEETAEAYAGFRALDVVSRPVRIEAELIRLQPAATVWKSSDTGLSALSLSRLIRKVGATERDRQLDQATAKAVKDVASDLSAALENIKPSPNRHEPHRGA